MLHRFKGIKLRAQTLALSQTHAKNSKDSHENLESFSTLYLRYYKPILKYVSRSIPSLDVAEEITQDIFLKVYQFKNSYKKEYKLSTWIWTIAKNTIYDYLRGAKLNHLLNYDIWNREDFEPACSDTAESILIKEHERRKLKHLMEGLSNRQRQIIMLRMVKKLSYEQISSSMNLSLSAVKSLLNRAKGSLIKKQADLNPYFPPKRTPAKN